MNKKTPLETANFPIIIRARENIHSGSTERQTLSSIEHEVCSI